MKLKRILPLLLSICMVGSAFSGCTVTITPNTGDNETENTGTDTGGSNENSSSGNENSGSGNDNSGSGSSDSSSDDKNENEGNGNASTDSAEGGTNTDTTDTTDETDTTNGGTDKTTAYLVGDSTVCAFSDSDYYLPRYGYGTQLENYLNSNVTISNLAISGKSSRDYLTTSNYTTLCESIGEGDYLIIGFGHNDEKSGSTFTDPNPDYKTATSSSGDVSFQYNLYENYIKIALEKGATPILCTPIVRYSSSASYSGERAHITDAGDYPEAIRTLGKATNTTVIDLTAITKAIYIEKGTDAMNYHAFTEAVSGVRDDTSIDNTHLNKYGAKKVAYELAKALQDTSCQLKHYVLSDISEPTYNSDLTVASDYSDAINADYVELEYTAFDAASYTSNKLTSDGWYKTVMGDASSKDKFTITESSGTFTVANTGGQGKFASGGDGFAAAFMQISVEKNFTATVTVKVTALASGTSNANQSGFGMMIRDDIYVDTIKSSIKSTFAAAGFLGAEKVSMADPVSMYAGFSRESNSLKNTSNTVSVSVGSTYTLTIQRENQTVYVTISDGTNTYKETYSDLNLYKVDSNYMYLCLFANRGITAEFSNFTMTDDGTAQTA